MKTIVNFKVDDKLRKILQEQALDENRTLSNFLLNAVLTYLKEKKGIDYKAPIR